MKGDHEANSLLIVESTGKDEECDHSTTKPFVNVPQNVAGSKHDPYRWYRIIKHCLVVGTMIGFGMSLEVIGPTLPDLKERLEVTYSDMSRCLAYRSVGTLVGTLIAGYTLERFRDLTDAIFGMSLVSLGILTAMIPISCCLSVAYVVYGICGVAEALVNTSASVLIIRLWLSKAASPLHSSSLGFTIGAAITPHMVRPFLSPDKQDIIANITTTTIPMEPRNVTQIYKDASRIEIPYMIIGIILSIFGLIFIASHFKGLPNGFEIDVKISKKKNFKSMVNPASCGYGNFSYGFELLACMFLYYLIIMGLLGSLRFVFAFAIESPLQMTKSEATTVVTVFFSCAAASRVLSVILVKFIPINIFVIINVLMLLATCVVMAIYGHYIRGILWTCSGFLGLLTACLWPNGTSWANRYLQMNSMGIMILMIGKSCGLFIVQFVTGHLFDINPRYLTYVFLMCSGVLVCLVGVMNIIIRCHRNLSEQHDVGIDDELSISTDGIPSVSTEQHTKINAEQSRL